MRSRGLPKRFLSADADAFAGALPLSVFVIREKHREGENVRFLGGVWSIHAVRWVV